MMTDAVSTEQTHARETYKIKTFEEASALAGKLAEYFPDYYTAYYGISEIMLNAIEHGNLGITYEEKLALLHDERWIEEVERRLNLRENQHKFVTVEVVRTGTEICIIITDMGNGFNWQEFSEITTERANQPAGRGIATTLALGFADIKFRGTGNIVECRLAIES